MTPVAPGTGGAGPARRRRRWPFVLLLLAVLSLGALALVWNLVDAVNVIPVSLTIDGQTVLRDIDLAALPPAHKVVLVAVLSFAVLTLVLAVPVALLLAVAALALALLLPVAVGLAALAIVLSPLWLLGWLVWRAVRPAGAPAASRPTAASAAAGPSAPSASSTRMGA